MDVNRNKWVVVRSIWFLWIVVTIVYLAFSFGGRLNETPTFLGHVGGFVGLFVPFGIFSLALVFSSLSGLISFILFLILMVAVDRWLNRLNFSLGKRILVNFLALLLITTVVDLVRFTPFASWRIFLRGAFPHYF